MLSIYIFTFPLVFYPTLISEFFFFLKNKLTKNKLYTIHVSFQLPSNIFLLIFYMLFIYTPYFFAKCRLIHLYRFKRKKLTIKTIFTYICLIIL